MPRNYTRPEERLALLALEALGALELDPHAGSKPLAQKRPFLQPLCPSCLTALDPPQLQMCPRHIHINTQCPSCGAEDDSWWFLSVVFNDLKEFAELAERGQTDDDDEGGGT